MLLSAYVKFSNTDFVTIVKLLLVFNTSRLLKK
jgi:hypothetical protein